jgi:hypothetical protein
MIANSRLRQRLEANKRPATFSAWAMSVVFAAIAVISFAVDQTVTLSDAAGFDRDGVRAPRMGEGVAGFGPVRLIQSLIDPASDRADHAE